MPSQGLYIQKKLIGFADIIGQEHVLNLLRKIITNTDKYPKSLIFNGPYGTGKTTSAFAFVNELNIVNQNQYKFHVYDAGVFRKVDQMEDIKHFIDSVLMYSSNFQIIIFEEIHFASEEAQGLLLKTLENFENSNVHFIFTTTNYLKLLPTIRSRSIPFHFKLLTDEQIRTNIVKLSDNTIGEETIAIIVRYSQGHMRDAVKLLDLHNIDPELFVDNTVLVYDLINRYCFAGAKVEQELFLHNASNIMQNLEMVMTDFIKSNVDADFNFTSKLFLEYVKYKGLVEDSGDVESFLRILKKFIEINNKSKLKI